MRRPSRYIHDDGLGYVPRPGHIEPGLTIDSAGLRTTGPAADTAALLPPILAVGDSFTFGEQVADAETWPAKLQGRSARRVLNGGVSGYGFDQIVLRAEQLAAIHKPGFVVVGFIADDVERTEMRRLWWRNKPWFTLAGDRLTLEGTPVPPSVRPRLLGSSRPLELLLRRLAPAAQHRLGYHVRVHPKGTGVVIAARLIERLGVLQQESGARVVLVAEYDGHAWNDRAAADRQRRITGNLLDGAARCGLHPLDSFSLFASAPRPGRFYKAWHMNEHGNRMVASLVASALGGDA